MYRAELVALVFVLAIHDAMVQGADCHQAARR
jgi:hypothetical protein